MGERAIVNRIKKLQALEEEKKILETQIEELKGQLKKTWKKKELKRFKLVRSLSVGKQF